MPLTKMIDLAYGRLRAPDLDVAEEFLTNFGMVRAERTPTALYMRGTDPAPHIHVTEKGDPGFVGLAYYAASLDDLKRLASSPGASAVESVDEPGGGKRVRLREPNGYQVEVLYGVKKLKPISVKRQPLNMGQDSLKRAGTVLRLPPGASRVKRIGHGVMAVPDVKTTVAWFREMLGFIGSDDVYEGSEDNLIGSFNRFNRGSTYVDHHALFCIRNTRAGLNHLSFEVQDIDDVFMGHEHLARLGKYEHMWGIGRHLLGSQVYDYWADPWGRVHEHWSDTDRLNAKNGTNLISVEEGFRSQWGERAPQKFIERVCP
jgi:catechol 2,3-dioxygenase-like lactoylglutathione lyase family enzyme